MTATSTLEGCSSGSVNGAGFHTTEIKVVGKRYNTGGEENDGPQEAIIEGHTTLFFPWCALHSFL